LAKKYHKATEEADRVYREKMERVVALVHPLILMHAKLECGCFPPESYLRLACEELNIRFRTETGRLEQALACLLWLYPDGAEVSEVISNTE